MNAIKKWFNSSNLIALFAVFVAMGSTAIAVTKAPKNSVTSPSIRNGAVTGKDVKDNSLTGVDIDEKSLGAAAGPGPAGATGAEGPQGPIGPTGPAGPLNAAGGDLTGQYPAPSIAPNAVGSDEVTDNTLTGADVNESSLDVPEARQGGIGRYGFIGECDPNRTDEFSSCAETTINIGVPGRLLVIGTLEAVVDPGKEIGLADCRLWTNRGTIGASTTPVSVSDDYESEQATLTAVTDVVPTGDTRVGLECNQRATGGQGGIEFPHARLSVVALSGE